MPTLRGCITDRILAGLIPADPLAPRTQVDDRPKLASIRYGEGHGLGEGAARTRSAEGAQWR